jgi:predicted nucleic acid-binding protein
MSEYLIDNSALHAYTNVSDKLHKSSKQFFDENVGACFYFSVHSLFEFQASRHRRIRSKSFIGLPGNHKLEKQKCVQLDLHFYQECQSDRLFELFKDLKGMDLIYACIAKRGKLTLVTCDSDFDVYSNEISLLKLN